MITRNQLLGFANYFLEDKTNQAIINTQSDREIESEAWPAACEYFEFENVESSFDQIVDAITHRAHLRK